MAIDTDAAGEAMMRGAVTEVVERSERDTRVTQKMKIRFLLSQKDRRCVTQFGGAERAFCHRTFFPHREDPTAAGEAIRDQMKANEHQTGKWT